MCVVNAIRYFLNFVENFIYFSQILEYNATYNLDTILSLARSHPNIAKQFYVMRNVTDFNPSRSVINIGIMEEYN